MLYQLIDMMIKQNFLNNIYIGAHFINPIMDLSWKVRQDTGQYFNVTNYYTYAMPYADLNCYDCANYSDL